MPLLGCRCETCTSDDPRDRRTRHGALLALDGGNLLVDTPPELRLQLLACGAPPVDAVWYTHLHADHVHGIDDVRVFSTRGRNALPTYVPEDLKDLMTARFPYIFHDQARVSPGTTKPRLRLQTYAEGAAVYVLGERVEPFRVPHGLDDAFGFRIGRLGYVTDAKSLPPSARRILDGVSVLVLNALWWGDPHPTHFNVEEAVASAQEIGADRTYLTHMTHRLRHADLAAALPPGIEPAYDGLAVEVD